MNIFLAESNEQGQNSEIQHRLNVDREVNKKKKRVSSLQSI